MVYTGASFHITAEIHKHRHTHTVHTWCVIILSSQSESTQWHKVSGEQVFMPLREIRVLKIQAEKDPLSFPTCSCPACIYRFLFSTVITVIFDPCSFSSFLSHHPLCCCVFFSPDSSLLVCLCCASFYVSKSPPSQYLVHLAWFLLEIPPTRFTTAVPYVYRQMTASLDNISSFLLFTTHCSKRSVYDRTAHHMVYNSA